VDGLPQAGAHAHLAVRVAAWVSAVLVPRDVLAGLTVWAVLVPESLAHATIAGVPPVVGLYAAVPALVLYAALGSSRHLVVGPMPATAALSAGTVAVFAASGTDRYVALTTALALVTGVLAVVAGLMRLGALTSRELQVLGLLDSVAPMYVIAGRLYVTMNTLKTHVAAIYRKLGADGRADAVDRACTLGLLPPAGEPVELVGRAGDGTR
jgi:DNA-binding CsgD family transcriptional regulator